MFLLQVASLGPLPLQSVLCIADLTFVITAAVSPNFPHLIAVVFCVIEACEDSSTDIVRIFLHQVDTISTILLCLLSIGAGRPEEVHPNSMGR